MKLTNTDVFHDELVRPNSLCDAIDLGSEYLGYCVRGAVIHSANFPIGLSSTLNIPMQ